MPKQKTLLADSVCPPLENGVLRIYSNGVCPYAQKTRLVLLHKNIPHEIVNVGLSKWKPAWYLTKHPFGTVPCLEQDGKLIRESTICCEYLDDVYPGPKLTPSDPYQRAKDKFLLEKWSKVTTLIYAVTRTKGEDQSVVDDHRSKLDAVESELAERGTPFFGGAEPMLVDFLIWPHMERTILQKDVISSSLALSSDRFPKLLEWIDRMTSVPAVKATLIPKETYAKFRASLEAGEPDYDLVLNLN